MRAFGVEITPLFLAILSSSSSVCGGEPTQGEEGKKDGERDREEVWRDLIGRTDADGRTGSVFHLKVGNADNLEWANVNGEGTLLSLVR